MTSAEPARTVELSDTPADYLSGPTRDTVNPTEGGTTRDGKVAVFGPSTTVQPVGEDDDEGDD